MDRTRAAGLLAASAIGVSLLSSCGAGPGSRSTAALPGTHGAGRDATPSLSAKRIGSLGKVVTDNRGMTLYRFDSDSARPPASNCNGPCAALWPPVTTTATEVGLTGIDKTLVGTVTRVDGHTQLTLKGWPLYRYAKDTKPGEAKGQLVGNTWFAAAPDGGKVLASDSRDTGYGY
jgi:predicted lipoprotein with Yx(FWY)xxD motif